MTIAMRWISLMVVLLAASAPAHAGGPHGSHKYDIRLEDFRSGDFEAISAALPSLKKLRPTWTSYQIELIELDNSFLVLFWRPEDARERQILGEHGGYVKDILKYGALQVEVEKGTLRILAAHDYELG